MDDYLYNIGGVRSKAPIALPPKFKISDTEKFDGRGDPKQHIRRYLSIVEMKGLIRSKLCMRFPFHSREVRQGGTIVLIQAKLRCGMN